MAYAQGSTLDIHMRSVLHQTRACRQEQQKVGGATPEQQNGQGQVANSQNSQMYKQLLENFGFDIVRQFNENGGAGLISQGQPQSGGQPGTEEIPADLLERFAAQFKHYLEKEGGETNPEALDFTTKREAPPPVEDPALLAQRLMEQQFLQQFPQIAQSLQQLGGAGAAGAGGSLNTLDMLNLVQFHHLMSLNFMNLAPPLIFGQNQPNNTVASGAQQSGATAAAAQQQQSQQQQQQQQASNNQQNNQNNQVII